MSSLPFNKVCEFEDFSHPELADLIRDVLGYKLRQLPTFPEGSEHRKDWEVAMAVRALQHFGATGPDATILGVAAGCEDTLFYLTKHARQVFATDRYLGSGVWAEVAPLTMLVEPAMVAPFEFDESRLVAMNMDGRCLRFPDETFDGVFSSGSIEHFGEFSDVANAAYEMGRVLKRGGVVSLSTEFRIAGPPGGIGWPGIMLVFSKEELQRYIVDASGLELVDDLQVQLSPTTLREPRNLSETVSQRTALIAANGPDGTAEYALWDFPHLILVQEGYVFGSVHLTLRKTDRYPLVPNEWAKPTQAVIDSVRQYHRALVDSFMAPAPAPAPAAVPVQSEPVVVLSEPRPTGLRTWEERDAVRRDRELRFAVCRESAEAHLGELSRTVQQIDDTIAEVDELRRDADAGLRECQRAPEVPEVFERRPEPPRGTTSPAPSTSWARAPLPHGPDVWLAHDRSVHDPVTSLLVGGTSVDANLLGLMGQIVRPDDVVVDLGAHIGTFSLAAAARGCRVLAVEAGPKNAANLVASAVRNKFDNLRVVNAAASDEPGDVSFIERGPWGFVATDSDAEAAPDEDPVTVPAVRIDDVLLALDWESVAFVKMDIEGSEVRAIRGMFNTLATPDSPPVLFESNGHTLHFYGLTPKALLGELERHGYTSYHIFPGRLVRTRADELQPQTIVDYLALKRPPKGLDGWQIEGEMSFEERIELLVADSRMVNEHHRAHFARAMADADEAIVGHPAIVDALDALGDDPSEFVRSAAQWWTSARDRRAGTGRR